MKKTHGLAVIALALSLAAGCSRAEHAPPPPAGAASAPAALAAADREGNDASGDQTASAPLAPGRALIMTSELRLTTKNVDAASAKLRDEVERAGGYVSAANETGIGDMRSATIEVRVPTKATRAVRVMLSDLGEITSDVEKVEDVTEARADLEARLASARATEKRILEIMNNKTGSISQVIEVEHELARVRETIERLEAQQRSMEGRIALATIKIHLEAPAVAWKAEPAAWETPAASITRAFATGLRGAAALAVYAAMAVAAASPILVPFGIVLAIVLMLLQSQKKRRAEREAAAAAGSVGLA